MAAPVEDVDLDDYDEWDPNTASFSTHMVAGSMAGVTEHLVVFPLDTLKVRLPHVQGVWLSR
jgi:hypothetical protein